MYNVILVNACSRLAVGGVNPAELITEPKNLMYIIPGAEHAALHFLVPEKCLNTEDYPIIIADIAPRVLGNLMHFNWPRLLRKSQITGFGCYKRPTIFGFIEYKRKREVYKHYTVRIIED